jgi:hypothetical protein
MPRPEVCPIHQSARFARDFIKPFLFNAVLKFCSLSSWRNPNDKTGSSRRVCYRGVGSRDYERRYWIIGRRRRWIEKGSHGRVIFLRSGIVKIIDFDGFTWYSSGKCSWEPFFVKYSAV